MRWDSVQGMFRVYEMGGGGGDAPTSSTSVTQNFSPEEAAQRAKVQEEAARIYAQSAGQLQSAPYPGAQPVPFSPETQQAQGALTGYATGAGQTLADTATGYSNFLMGDAQYAGSNPYLQSAIGAATRPVTEAYTGPGGVMGQIRQGATAGGQYGSSRQGIAEGVAARGYLDTVGGISSSMANTNYQDSMKLGTAALGMAPQTYGLGTQPATSLAAVGQQKEMLDQANEDYAAQARMWELNAPWAPLQNYASIVFGGSSPGTSASTQGSAAQTSRFGGAMGGASMGASIGSMIPGVGSMIGGGLGLLGGLLFG